MYIAHVFILPLFLGFTGSSTISTVEGATDTTATKKSTEDHNDDDTSTQVDTSYSTSTGENKYNQNNLLCAAQMEKNKARK